MEYTGRGGLVYAILILQGVAQTTFFFVFKNTYGTLIWGHLGFGAASAVLCFLIGRSFNRDLPQTFIDYQRLENGREGAIGHTFLFVRMEYGGIVTIPGSLLGWWLLINEFFES